MRAVVLAAGLGTRLGELTADRQKGALIVGGRPLVAHVVEHVHRCGFGDIAVNLHYRPEQVREALADARPRITWFEEPDLLGTAGALEPMHAFLDKEPAFLVHYGDVLTDHDVGAMVRRHRERKALLTLLVHKREGSNSVVGVDPDWRVREFLERPSEAARDRIRSPWVNSGVYALAPELLGHLAAPPSDVARDLVPRALALGQVFAEPLVGYRCAVDAPARLAEAQAAFDEGRWNSPFSDGGLS
jgi:NDP-sugar pyrophosphorylase family protein